MLPINKQINAFSQNVKLILLSVEMFCILVKRLKGSNYNWMTLKSFWPSLTIELAHDLRIFELIFSCKLAVPSLILFSKFRSDISFTYSNNFLFHSNNEKNIHGKSMANCNPYHQMDSLHNCHLLLCFVDERCN